MAVKEFQGKYRFLSNFWNLPVNPVMLDGMPYPTVEHAYQAAKTLDPQRREVIRMQETPGKAKRAGRKVRIRADWEKVKLSIMEDLVRQKFTNSDNLTERLLKTGDQELIEGNTWNDTFWGRCRGVGKNHLGKILMKIREELR